MKRINYYIELALIFIIQLTCLFIITFLTYKLEYFLIIFIISTIIILGASIFLISYLFINPIKEANQVLNHYNDGNYNFSSNDVSSKESYELAKNINNLGKKMTSTTNLLKEKISENETYFARYKQDIETKKQLVASISHEIKTPLAVIEATASAIIDEIFTGDEVKTELKNIMRETNKTNKMLQEIVSIYKLESSKLALELKEINLKSTVTLITEELNNLINKYEQNINIEIKDNLIIKADELQFKRAIKNIILNAILYSPKSSTISIITEEREQYKILKIINYGITICKEDFTHLFEPFYQADKSREKKEDIGNGLGLYIVKEILEKHNFDYGIQNINNGVQFYIIFR